MDAEGLPSDGSELSRAYHLSHCGNGEAELLPPFGDRSDYRCPHCGAFSVDGTQEHRFNTGHADPREARFVVRNGRRWLKE
jgi:hypothetical protein